MFRFVIVAALFGVGLSLLTAADEKHVTEIAKSAHALKTTDPLPLYHSNPNHLWNRLFAALYIRKSHLPEKPGGKPVEKMRGATSSISLPGRERRTGLTRKPRPG